MSRFLVVIALLMATPALCAQSGQGMAANPIRKVVTMLQNMVKKIEVEAEKQKETFEKFMCWCETSITDLTASIDGATTKIPQVESSIEETTSALAALKQGLIDDKKGREDAKAAMAKATEQRAKEYEVFTKESGDLKTNLAAMKKAIAAIEKGTGGAFLQTESASVLRNFVVNDESLSDLDRDVVAAFLSVDNDNNEGSADSGQIVGILKAQSDTMAKTLEETLATEAAAKKTYDELMAAKTKEVATLTAGIEDKIVRIGDTGVALAQMKEDLDDTKKDLVDDKKFLADTEKTCTVQKDNWALIEKMRKEELLALADTIKMLNSDEALELFKKTLPAGASFIQELVTYEQMRTRALSLLQRARRNTHWAPSRVPLELITMALTGKKVDFSKVLGKIDELVDILGKEQEADDAKKDWCGKEIDKIEDKKKEILHEISDLDELLEDTKEKIATTKDEMKALAEGIVDLDKDVVEATDIRKEENSDYKTMVAGNTAAKDLILMAKERMQKFYNPSLLQNAGAPPPPPAAIPAYSKKSEESGGVMAMMDMMVADIDKELQTAEVEEKNAQEEYEQFLKDSADKRELDSKTITDKESALAEMEGEEAKAMDDREGKAGELAAAEEMLAGTHAECDWLVENYESRKAAREGEVESLKKAKAVLSGADFSLIQEHVSRRTLRGPRRA